ncbi:MAG: hypothetical protein Q4D07_10350, partial [Selenomonadaceae bacterium]|nr:hypothetical protein [Selenomonadaceae bacterium]
VKRAASVRPEPGSNSPLYVQSACRVFLSIPAFGFVDVHQYIFLSLPWSEQKYLSNQADISS